MRSPQTHASAPQQTGARPVDLHDWVKVPQSEPLRCSKCGTYYSDPRADMKCPAMHEAV